MKTINSDIFKGKWNGMVHCANLYHTFGAGIAKIIKTKYPEAYKADMKTHYGCESKLGWFSVAKEEAENGEIKSIFNLYAQVGIGNNKDPLERNCRYDYLHDGVWRICKDISESLSYGEEYVLAFPHGMCCGLAGGDWSIAEAILKSVNQRFPNIEFVIYKL